MKHLLETSLKPDETLDPEKVTFMFQVSFKDESCKYLILLKPIETKERLKQRCFPNCFTKTGYFMLMRGVFRFLKQFAVIIPQTGVKKKPH